jgi:uridine kinase
MRNVILFGPPGIGKTTIIKRLAADYCNVGAIDLEDYWGKPATVRDIVELLRLYDRLLMRGVSLKPFIVGAAGVDPKPGNPPGLKVLLTLPQDVYERRRQTRDMAVLEKREQPPHLISNWERITSWDAVMVTNNQVITRIVSLATRKE